MTEPRGFADILKAGCVPGRDFLVSFGDAKIERSLLIAPHGGGIEPGSSEVMRAVAEIGGWAWYDFAGFLRKGNKEALHIASTCFDEPTLLALLPQTSFVVAFHGASETEEPTVQVGGRWERGRKSVMDSINAASGNHGVRAIEATEASGLRGLEEANITNRGRRKEGIQLEFSRGARTLLFPPDASREARGRRNERLRPLALSIHTAIKQLGEMADLARA